MAKVLLGLENFSENLIPFIVDILPEKERHLYVGITIRNPNTMYSLYSEVFRHDLKKNLLRGEATEQVMEQSTDDGSELVASFEWSMQKFSFDYDVHFNFRDNKVADETSFADLLLFSLNISEDNYRAGRLELRALLRSVNCPVLMVPYEALQPIENIIIPLGDPKLSVYTLKLFSYLFPLISGRKRIIVMAKKPENERGMHQENSLIEFIRNHFVNPAFQWFESDNIGEEVCEYIKGIPSPMLVLGNDRNNNKVSLFSYNDLLKMQTIPIFIGNR